MARIFDRVLCGWLFALAIAGLSGIALAQTTATYDAGKLETLFQSTETLLEQQPQVDVKVLEEQRALIAEQRALLRTISVQESVEARALQAQLDAMGPPPAEGATEADATADRRKQLQDAIAQANAPVLAAREALTRAEVILQELDTLIRSSSTRELLRRYPSPLSPSTWQVTARELGAFGTRIGDDLSVRLAKPGAHEHLVSALPVAVMLLAFGLFMIGFAQKRLTRWLISASGAAPQGRRVLLLAAANLVLLVVPAIGALALIVILPVLDLVPDWPPGLIMSLVGIAAILIVANWLSVTLFSTGSRADARIAARAGLLTRLLGVAVVLEILAETASRLPWASDASNAALTLPVVAFAAFLLWQMANVLLQLRAGPGSNQAHAPDAGLTWFLARAMQVAAVTALVLALLGYVNLARSTVVPILLTLAIVGLAVFFYRAVLRMTSVVIGRGDGVESFQGSLIPVALVIVLVVALSPILAIVWGSSPDDVAEVWRAMTEGVVVGDMRLSLDGLLALVAVLLIGVLATRWLQRFLRLTVLPRTRLDAGAQSALNKGVGYLGITLSALLAVSAAGLNLSNLAVVVGALSVGIGLGLQNIVSNFVSGIILLVERPIKEGDWIEVSGKSGIVRKIAVRSTRIETADRHDVIVPNLDLISGTVTNFTLSTPTGRLVLPIGIAYGSNVESARDIITQVAQAHPSVLADPAPSVLFASLGESALEFQLTCFVEDETQGAVVRSDLLFAIHSGLQKAGIEIPFPQRDIRLRDIDALVRALAGVRTPGTAP